MTTTPPREAGNDEARLDQLLEALAHSYRQQAVPPQALEKLKATLAAENRTLTDDELEWLVAAGNDVDRDKDQDTE